MGYNKQLVYPAFFNLYHFKQKSDPELPMIRNYRKHCTTECSTYASYLDVLLKLDTNGKITTQLYYKQDDFNFSIINSLLDIRSVFGSRESTDKQVDVTGVSTGGLAGGRASLIGYLLCVINSSHTF